MAKQLIDAGQDYQPHGSKLSHEDRVATMVHMEAQRAGLDVQPYEIAKALLAGKSQDPGVQRFLSAVKGAPVPEASWTRERIEQLGRNPEPRELSPEGRAAYSRNANLKFLNSLLGGERGETGKYNAGIDWHDRWGSSGKTHGESGWIGAMTNPEYKFGSAVNYVFQPVSDAAHMQFSGQQPPSKNELAAEVISGPMARLGGIARRFVTRHLPDALDLADARAAANRVERVIPAGMTIEQGNEALDRARDSGGPNFDEWYRLKYGEYPPYALSSAAVFGNGMLDPSLLVTGPAAKVATGVGRALMHAGKYGLMGGGLGNAALRGLYSYGKSVAKGAGALAKYPAIQAALKEGAEEGPFNAAIMGASAAVHGTPEFIDWFTPGTKQRTDLYVDGKPQGDADFLRKMYDDPNLATKWDKERQMTVPDGDPVHGPNSKLNAAQTRRQIPGLMNQIRQTLLQP